MPYLVKGNIINGNDMFVTVGNNLEVQNQLLCKNDDILSSFIRIVSKGNLVCFLLEDIF